MHHSPSNLLIQLLLLCAAVISFSVTAQQEEPSSYLDFSALPAYGTPALAPDGTKVAFVQNVTSPNELTMLATYDFKKGKKYYLLQTDNEEVHVNWYKWVNNERSVSYTHLTLPTIYSV